MKAVRRALAAAVLFSSAAVAQQYVISTYAGGVPPLPSPAPGVNVSIGAPLSIATDAARNVYFASSLNVIFKLDQNGVLTRVAGNSRSGYSGDGGPATSAELQLYFNNASAVWAGLAVDRAGNLFIADTSNHCVRRVSPDGIITTVAGNGTRGFSGDGGPAINAQLRFPWGVAVDGAGNLFIVDAFNYRVRKISPSGIITTAAGGGTLLGASADGGPATSAQLSAWAVAADSAGNLFIADNASGRIRKVSPNGIITTVADNVGAWGVAVDAAGNLYIADWGGHVRKVSPDGITTVAGGGTAGLGDGGPATSALMDPAGLAVDGVGNLFIADRFNHRIRKVSASGIITTVAGSGKLADASSDGGPATTAQLFGPYGVAVDGADSLFIADANNNRIRKVSRGGIITTVAGNGMAGFSGDGGPATSAQLSYPAGVAVDGEGNLFILDADNSRIRKVTPDGVITTVAGNGTVGFSGDGGPATRASLSNFYPCNTTCGGVAVDGSGNLFIADSGNNRVRRVSPDGIITTVAGGGEDFPGDGEPATNAHIGALGVAVDGGGNLFIADGRGIRKVSTSGIITTLAGGGTVTGDGGPATSAQLSEPAGVAVDGAGNLFIADPGSIFFTGIDFSDAHDRVRKVSPSGTITTVAGTGNGGSSGDGGAAITAQLNAPTGVAVDSAGNVYIADSGNNVIRVLRPTDKFVLIGAVVDAASQRADPISPGKIVTIYGAGLGPSQLIQNQPSNNLFGTELSGTKVAFNGIAAPLLYTSATQVAAVAPYSTTGATAQVTVTYQGQISNTFSVPVTASAPGLFTLNQAGWGQAAAINGVDGTLNTAANPVKIGGYISLYATGEGQSAPAGVDGRIAGSTPSRPVLPLRATVAGIPATVQYAGGAPGIVAGVMQVNVQIPSGVQPGGYVPVVLQVGDRSSSPAVWIAVSGN